MTVVVNPPPGDTTPPVISSVASSNVTQNGATITWATDEPSTSRVEYVTTTAHGSATSVDTSLVTSHTQVVSGLAGTTVYHYRVVSTDASGNTASSGDYVFSTPAPVDTQPPTAPANLVATAASPTEVDLTWSASTDNVGVTGYQVWRNGVQRATIGSTAFADTTVSAGSTYTHTVRASDAAGNVSGDSNAATVTTPQATAGPAVDVQATTKQSSAASIISSPTFSTAAAGELLVAFIASDGPSGSQSISAVTGGGYGRHGRRR